MNASVLIGSCYFLLLLQLWASFHNLSDQNPHKHTNDQSHSYFLTPCSLKHKSFVDMLLFHSRIPFSICSVALQENLFELNSLFLFPLIFCSQPLNILFFNSASIKKISLHSFFEKHSHFVFEEFFFAFYRLKSNFSPILLHPSYSDGIYYTQSEGLNLYYLVFSLNLTDSRFCFFLSDSNYPF